MHKRIAQILILVIGLTLLAACSKDKSEPVEYAESEFREISFEYPTNYKEDFRDDVRVSYLLNGNEGIIFIVRFEGNLNTDLERHGEVREVNGIKGAYTKVLDEKTEEPEYDFIFFTQDKDGKTVQYNISADNEEVFWKVIHSIKIK